MTSKNQQQRKRFGTARRSLVALLPAAIVTGILYLAMDRMIIVEEVQLAKAPERTLAVITPMIEDTTDPLPTRTQPERMDAVTPPPPPKLGIQRDNVVLPVVNLTGSAPKALDFVGIRKIAYPPAAIGDRGLVVIRPPVPAYPSSAAVRRLEGKCDVRFDVDSRGRPFNVNAVCSDDVFKRAAERAVASAEFAPRIVDDRPVERRNVVYPVNFSLR